MLHLATWLICCLRQSDYIFANIRAATQSISRKLTEIVRED
jgi:hypothetical protein